MPSEFKKKKQPHLNISQPVERDAANRFTDDRFFIKPEKGTFYSIFRETINSTIKAWRYVNVLVSNTLSYLRTFDRNDPFILNGHKSESD